MSWVSPPWDKSLDERLKSKQIRSNPFPSKSKKKKRKKKIWHLGFSGLFFELQEKGRQDRRPDSPRRIALLGRGSGVGHTSCPHSLRLDRGVLAPVISCPPQGTALGPWPLLLTRAHLLLGHMGLAILPLQPHPTLHHKFSFRRPSLRRASRRASSVEPRPENWTVIPWGLNPTALGSDPDRFLASWLQSGCRCS